MTDDAVRRRRPRAPAGLGAGGRRLWEAILREYDLRPDEVILLRQAAREADLVDRLQAELDDAELVVRGSLGQPAASPLVSEVRLHRQVLATLLKALKLPEGNSRGGDGARSWNASLNARKAARARWGTPSL